MEALLEAWLAASSVNGLRATHPNITINLLRLLPIQRGVHTTFLQKVALLQGEIPYKIAPFFGIHRGPDEEQIVYD